VEQVEQEVRHQLPELRSHGLVVVAVVRLRLEGRVLAVLAVVVEAVPQVRLELLELQTQEAEEEAAAIVKMAAQEVLALLLFLMLIPLNELLEAQFQTMEQAFH
jgi:hypothetical protein